RFVQHGGDDRRDGGLSFAGRPGCTRAGYRRRPVVLPQAGPSRAFRPRLRGGPPFYGIEFFFLTFYPSKSL
ncbi:MAG: hypothetical protein ACOC7X_00400, partial [Spirochaetota bacterium]